MGLFDKFKKSNNESESVVASSPTPMPASSSQPSGGLLNLNKGDILNLTKTNASLQRVKAAAGWTSGFDLDLCAYLKKHEEVLDTVYYGHKRKTGIFLNGDDLHGGGKGDNEAISVDLKKISPLVDEIVFAVVIYQGASRHQYFSKVQNAYVRLVDEDTDAEICRYQMNEDDGKHTAIVAGKLIRNGEDWEFKAVGDYHNASINNLSV